MNNSGFSHSQYVIKRKFFEILGQQYKIYDPQGLLVLCAKMKAFKLKEDIRLYRDEAMTQEALVIKARQIIDFSASYDVFDPATNQRLGSLRRKGMESILKDEWEILDVNEAVIGSIEEDSWALALLRRFLLGSLIPQHYDIKSAGLVVARCIRHFSFFIHKMTVEILPGSTGRLDPRFLIAAGLLLSAIEGKQK